MDRERSRWSWPGAAIAGIAAAILIVLLTLGLREGGFGCDFDRKEWLEATAGKFGDYEKAEPIADDLIRCDDPLYGRSMTEVRSLLGERDFGYREKEAGDEVWGYDIGIPGALSDYPGLQVRFDEMGRVEEVSVPGYKER